MGAPITNNSKSYSCWNCDKFQPAAAQEGVYDGSGECRAFPPAQCCSVDETEPVFAEITFGPSFWCAAWKRRNPEMPALPDPVAPQV